MTRRAGPRQLIHLVRVHLRHDLAEPVGRLTVPLLVMRGREDPMSTSGWCRRLAALVPDGHYVEVAGPHSFPWADPHAWSPPVRRLAAGLPRI